VTLPFESIRKVAVLGAGTMGHGIAEVTAIAGYDVVVRDVQQRFIDRAREKITWSVKKLAEKGELTEPADVVLSRITYSISLEEAVRSADLVIEAVPEDLEVKRAVYSEVAKFARPESILATNTSSIPITEIAGVVPEPGRVVGLHFFNPVVIMTLVEIIKGAQTSQATVDSIVSFSKKLGKRIVVVQQDIPGFIVNRIMARLMAASSIFVQLKLASVTEVDSSLKFRAGLPMGAFELADYVGLDVLLDVEKALSRRGYDIEPSPLFEERVRSGALGVKSGRGFYAYSAGEPRARVPAEQAGRVNFIDLLAPAVNEAAWLVSQHVATADDVDTAIMLGLGFPKGLLKMADEWGLDVVKASLESLYIMSAKEWLVPCEYLSGLVSEGHLGVKSGRGFFNYAISAEEPQGTVQTEKKGPIAYLILNRPEKLNAVNPAMIKDLTGALGAASSDPDVRVIVLKGGGRAFCVGFDLASFLEDTSPQHVLGLVRQFQELNNLVEGIPKPVIASVHGYALGGGMEIALACDLRFASASSKLGQTEVNLGFIPGAGGTQRVTRLVGPGRAKRLIFSGETIAASQAAQMGLLDGVFEDSKLAEEVEAFALSLAEKPPLAIAAAKKAINAATYPIGPGSEIEATSFAALFSSEDVKEGLGAFFEKRKPKFKGK
jgi:enoyl-CoA hydratase/3-hydroxyacyl-CoA dehydrogenase